MQRVIILGSASAVPTREQENTHLLVLAGKRTILVDCPGTPVVRIAEGGVDPLSVSDIILTHFHPDHVSGLASFLMVLWLLGRKQGMTIYGLEQTIRRAQQMMEMYDWETWPDFYPVEFVVVPETPLSVVLSDDDVRVLASPVDHLIPTSGLRFEFLRAGKTMAYSCDTEPSPAVVALASGADVLIHEATGSSKGHTSPEQAGAVAQQAGVKALYLIHYPPQPDGSTAWVDAAQSAYHGPVRLARDFDSIDL